MLFRTRVLVPMLYVLGYQVGAGSRRSIMGSGLAKPHPARILIVDDEPSVCSLLGDELRQQGYECTVATASEHAIELLDGDGFELVLTDIAMPRVSGLDLLVSVRRKLPHCRVVLMTAYGTTECIAQALFLGAFDFIEKPFEIGVLLAAVSRALRTEMELPALALRAADAMEFRDQAAGASLDSVLALVRAVEAKDAYTRRHSEQVAQYAKCIAQTMDLPRAMIERIRIAALLHDVGKIGVPDRVLTKAGPLTDEEFQCIRSHPVLGAEILGTIGLFKAESLLIRHHHERWDGGGYPDSLAAEESPLGARVIMVADCIDAMLMERTYKKGYSIDKMLGELVRCAGSQFDPQIAAASLEWCQSNREALFLPGKISMPEHLL